jgi:tetratricopeptide (TPR) repeat protein
MNYFCGEKALPIKRRLLMRLLMAFILVAAFSGQVWAEKVDEAVKHFAAGSALFKEGKFDSAIREFDEAVRLKPDFAMAYSLLGACYVSNGKYDLAIRQVEKAIRLDPEDAGFRYNLGVVYAKKGQYDEAIVQLEEAIKLEPDFPDAHNVLEQLYKLRGPDTRKGT